MPLDPSQRHSLMAITQEGLARSPQLQTQDLLAAGVRWIQLRLKGGTELERDETVREFVGGCREAGAVGIINDHVALAAKYRADGAHVGRLDGDWRTAREALGPEAILGGTINDARDVDRAHEAGCLDYVGLGPWRFTTTKKNLSPVLGAEGIGPLLVRLSPLPVWVIGGVVPGDLPAIRALGAAGVAVSGALVQASNLSVAVASFQRAWASS